MDAEKWTGIILAGGLSSRMGTNKALLELNGSAVLTHINNAIRPTVSRILVATGSSEAIYSALGDKDFECVQDVYTGKGPLAGLHAALSASQTEWNLLSACDMPLLQTSFFNGMKRLAVQYPTYNAIVPRVEGRIHPLAGLYHRHVLPELEQCLIHDRLRVIRWLEEIDCHFSEIDELEQVGIEHPALQLSNMNTPEEFENIRIRFQRFESPSGS
ncbi:molybdopterin-guanine dinucleotide biosynthesis protein A [Paenibacillus intestini]|nr:molybdopterin-guanine dinucleotide biosynthesis protein A [Paenibacillus intestini]